jgi:hypothetical protein
LSRPATLFFIAARIRVKRHPLMAPSKLNLP